MKRKTWLPSIPETISVYCLIDPTSDNVFYVGCTHDDLQTRLKGHIRHDTCSKGNWSIIYPLLKSGITPEIMLLDEVRFKDANFYEGFYISLFKSFGFSLTNVRYSNYCQTIGNRINNYLKTIVSVKRIPHKYTRKKKYIKNATKP